MKGGGSFRRIIDPHERYTKPIGQNVDDPCANLKIFQTISKPDVGLDSIKKGDVLTVLRHSDTIVKLENNKGELCGYLNQGNIHRLVECLKKHNFLAHVVSLNGRICDVEVKIER